MDVVGLIGLGIGASSLIFAYFQWKKAKNSVDFFRTVAWNLFHLHSNSMGHLQQGLRTLRTTADFLVIENLVRADAHSQDVFRQIIQVIQYAEPAFDEAHIEQWIQNGKVTEDKKDTFRQIAIEPRVQSK